MYVTITKRFKTMQYDGLTGNKGIDREELTTHTFYAKRITGGGKAKNIEINMGKVPINKTIEVLPETYRLTGTFNESTTDVAAKIETLNSPVKNIYSMFPIGHVMKVGISELSELPQQSVWTIRSFIPNSDVEPFTFELEIIRNRREEAIIV